MDSILIVGAHAMDAEVMAGGLAAYAVRRGVPVTLLHLTRGERGHPSKPPKSFARQLEDEMHLAAQTLGVSQEWAGFEAPLPDPELVAPILANTIFRTKASLVVTHWRGSWHRSHVRAHTAVAIALERVVHCPISYGENCEDLTGFQPNCFVPIDDVYETWLTALRAYELFRVSEFGGSRTETIPYWAYYVAAAKVRGLQSGLGRAQAFMCDPKSLPKCLEVRCLEQGV